MRPFASLLRIVSGWANQTDTDTAPFSHSRFVYARLHIVTEPALYAPHIGQASAGFLARSDADGTNMQLRWRRRPSEE